MDPFSGTKSCARATGGHGPQGGDNSDSLGLRAQGEGYASSYAFKNSSREMSDCLHMVRKVEPWILG